MHKAIQYLLLAVIVLAGVVGAVCFLHWVFWAPADAQVLPEWATAWLPERSSAMSGWLIFAMVATIVVSGLGVGWLQRIIERRDADA